MVKLRLAGVLEDPAIGRAVFLDGLDLCEVAAKAGECRIDLAKPGTEPGRGALPGSTEPNSTDLAWSAAGSILKAAPRWTW